MRFQINVCAVNSSQFSSILTRHNHSAAAETWKSAKNVKFLEISSIEASPKICRKPTKTSKKRISANFYLNFDQTLTGTNRIQRCRLAALQRHRLRTFLEKLKNMLSRFANRLALPNLPALKFEWDKVERYETLRVVVSVQCTIASINFFCSYFRKMRFPFPTKPKIEPNFIQNGQKF